MIKVLIDRQKSLVKVEGHANFAPKGQDIVCSAMSILVANLVEYFKEYQAKGEEEFIKMVKETFEDLKEKEDDDLKIKIFEERKTPLTVINFCEYHQIHFLVVNYFAIGVKLLADQYPENVSLEIIEYKE